MPDFKPYTIRQLDFALQAIGEAIYAVVAPLEVRAWCTREPVPYAERRSGEERALAVGSKWGDLFDCAWFHFTGRVPEAAAGHKVVLLLDVHGEMCVVDGAGNPIRGLTTVASVYDYSLGLPGKRVLPFLECAAGGERIDLWADAGCNDLFGNLQGNGTLKQADVAVCDEGVRALYYDFEVLLDLLKVLPADSPRYQQILTALNDVVHLVYSGIPRTAAQARAILAPLLAQKGGDPSLRITAVGHAHMDLAWLWPIRETIRKGARTFATALELMDRYPDYVFGASQPQYFLWMKEHYPALYARIAEKVCEGRIEPQGAMWVEADTNVSGGEALVRQLLQGKRFFQDEFGVDVRYLWLPDVFGYSAALPQILIKGGVDYFSTQKLSWSLINAFPHQSFHWQGIDGSSVLTHMLPEETYNSSAAPHAVHKIERNYHDSGVSEHALLVYGIGDGGGGPGAEHLERLVRIRNLAGLSPVTQGRVADFWPQWAADAARFPTWVGELYLERHEGTLTTEARNKWYNRKLELGLRELEWMAVLAGRLAGAAYPAERLQALWREVLLYQFHDILPGSSIKRVYDESVARYQAMFEEVKMRIADHDALLGGRIDAAGLDAPLLVQNSLSWERTEWVPAGERWIEATVPPMGYVVLDAADAPGRVAPLFASETELENDVLHVRFAADGTISSLWDKRAGREVIPEGERANRLLVFVDLGDAWDFPMDYAEQTPRAMELVLAEPRVEGPRAILKQVYHLRSADGSRLSVLIQEVTLTAGSPRLDFTSHLRWRETRSMLRTRFPVDVRADEATYEIQFGHIRRPAHRNTTWDLARDEVAAHKWVDVSQRDYGVALLNDCKYGHKVKSEGGTAVLDLNLLRSVPYPGPRLVQDEEVPPGAPHHAYTDQCDHVFTYALYPHPGDHVAGGVVRAGYELNVPLRATPLEDAPAAGGDLPRQASLLQVDAANVVVEAVKSAADVGAADGNATAVLDSRALIVRLYECERRGTRATIRFGFPVAEVAEATLMEEPFRPLELYENAVSVRFAPFEIVTLRVTPA
jgi:alpha-mannosidase